ncbi:protein lifeguard 1-like [Copidosoma floridanum]|uniref:protein lifeguard 1-like n=1 Tax=Copidosoma floridanum TaxID=29053 RepID=UPI0006C9596E|nr:protein lifeguard 1-like [Copidosoma floridanum]XP_014207237.1 protein lifeguard 1-like [Copidosoma floridanum]
MSTWQNPGGGYYPGQQGYPGYPGGGYPQQGYPGGAYPGGPYPGAPPPAGFAPPPGGAPPFIPPTSAGMYGANYAQDPMQDEIKGFQFNDTTIRQAFIRKVYSILMVQLLITFGIVAIFTYHMPTKKFAWSNPWIMWACLIATFVLLISMACCTSVRREAPMNYIFLGLFTFAEAIMLGFASSVSNQKYVIMAVGITAVICFSLTLFAFQTKIDFTGMGTYLFIAAIVFMLFGIIMMFFRPSNTMHLVYSSIGALLFSFYLVYDTQLMIGGSHKYSVSPEEYIFAALNLYLDIVNIFLYILSILNASSSD